MQFLSIKLNNLQFEMFIYKKKKGDKLNDQSFDLYIYIYIYNPL